MTMLLPGMRMRRREQRVAPLPLVPGSARAIAVHGGAVIRVLSGVVWLTEDKDEGDYVLGRGEEFVARRGGRVVVEAIRGMAAVSLL